MISWPFVAASLIVIVTPGPDLALITHLMPGAGGARAALSAAVGMMAAGAGAGRATAAARRATDGAVAVLMTGFAGYLLLS